MAIGIESRNQSGWENFCSRNEVWLSRDDDLVKGTRCLLEVPWLTRLGAFYCERVGYDVPWP